MKFFFWRKAWKLLEGSPTYYVLTAMKKYQKYMVTIFFLQKIMIFNYFNDFRTKSNIKIAHRYTMTF